MAEQQPIERTLSKTCTIRKSDGAVTVPDEVMDMLGWSRGDDLVLTLNLSANMLQLQKAS